MTPGVWTPTSVPPHFTGGAVDAILVKAESGEVINTAFRSANLGSEAIHTDYLEAVEVASYEIAQARLARRALHNVLSSAEVGGVGMQNNPTETWHYSLYDQAWARLGGHPAALYGVPPEIPAELELPEIKS